MGGCEKRARIVLRDRNLVLHLLLIRPDDILLQRRTDKPIISTRQCLQKPNRHTVARARACARSNSPKLEPEELEHARIHSRDPDLPHLRLLPPAIQERQHGSQLRVLEIPLRPGAGLLTDGLAGLKKGSGTAMARVGETVDVDGFFGDESILVYKVAEFWRNAEEVAVALRRERLVDLHGECS